MTKWPYERNNLVGETLLPESFACLFNPQQTVGNPLRAFGQSFENRFSKIEIFSGTAQFSSLYAGTSRVHPRVLAVRAKTLRWQLLLLLFPLSRKIFILGIIYSFPQQVTFKKI